MRIALFNSEGLYGVISYFTERLCAAFERQGVNCEIYNAYDGSLGEFIASLNTPPDFTCAISGKSCFNHDFFSLETGIPHISYCMDAPVYYFHLLTNPNNLVTFVDRSAFELVPQDRNAFFLSLATDPALAQVEIEKTFDVLMIGACFDFESIREEWLSWSQPLIKVMETSLERVFSAQPVSFPQALLLGLQEQEIPLDQVNFIGLCKTLENYMRGKDRLELLKAIKFPITIFGPHRFGPKSWKDYVGIFPNVTVYQGNWPYTETFENIRRCKIFLNSCPSLRDGGHERVFNGLLLGSLVVSNETSYYKEFFNDQHSLLYYQPGKWHEINEKIAYYLSNEKKRQDLVAAGKDIVLRHHTWDNRAKTLLQLMNQHVSK